MSTFVDIWTINMTHGTKKNLFCAAPKDGLNDAPPDSAIQGNLH
jgi:hypothetical protein